MSALCYMETDFNFADTEEADRIMALLLKQLRQTISAQEQQQLQDWVAAHDLHKQVYEQLNNEEQLLAGLLQLQQVNKEQWWQTICERSGITSPAPSFFRRRGVWAAAAGLLLAATTLCLYLIFSPSPKKNTSDNIASLAHVTAGGNTATLTLANGSVINLGSTANGTLATVDNATIVKLKDGEVRYEPSGRANAPGETAYNLLSTPRGGQYSLVLPDGSRVWLNATSSIKYPTYFNNRERRVTITGEAYFEVQPATGKKAIPFLVSILSPTGTRTAEVEALGTEFNINAYTDETSIKTTLLKGKVKVSVAGGRKTEVGGRKSEVGGLKSEAGTPVSSFKILSPGQQAQIPLGTTGTVTGDSIQLINHADTELAIAWKNGLHSFKNADIKTIMRVLGRWYQVAIAYEGNIPNYKFTGSIPRNENMPAVLHMLQYAGIHFRIEKDRVVVIP